MEPVLCPRCGCDTQLLAVIEAWNRYCPFCEIRFKVIESVAGVFQLSVADSGRGVIFTGNTAYIAKEGDWERKRALPVNTPEKLRTIDLSQGSAMETKKPYTPPQLKEIPPVDRSAQVLTDGSPVTDDHRELRPDGQQKAYVVLTEEERKKGFVRPVRRTYIHVGKDPTMNNHVLIKTGKGGCGQRTTMGIAIAETFARDPGFYSGGTFCCTCGVHLPLNEFIWEGTTEQMGT